MVAERITPQAVAAEAVAFDEQDRIVVAGQIVLNFGQVAAVAAMLSPREWEEVAAYLLALVEREPVKTSAAYLAHRTVLTAMGQELRLYARLAGEPVGLEADLRAATTQDEERRIRERMADRGAAAQRHLDEILADSDARREREDRERAADLAADAAAFAAHIDDESLEEEPIDQGPAAAPATEPDDDLAYL